MQSTLPFGGCNKVHAWKLLQCCSLCRTPVEKTQGCTSTDRTWHEMCLNSRCLTYQQQRLSFCCANRTTHYATIPGTCNRMQPKALSFASKSRSHSPATSCIGTQQRRPSFNSHTGPPSQPHPALFSTLQMLCLLAVHTLPEFLDLFLCFLGGSASKTHFWVSWTSYFLGRPF